MSSTAPSTGVKPARKKSKWEDLDDDDLPAAAAVPKPKRKKIKTFSTSLHASTPGVSSAEASPRTGPGSGSGSDSPLRRRTSLLGGPVTQHPLLQGCRSVYCYERLNHIEEGSYGVVSRARDKQTGDIVALKKLKMDQEKNGFPITSLREIRTLMMVGHHENIVRVREIVVGDTLTQCVPCLASLKSIKSL